MSLPDLVRCLTAAAVRPATTDHAPAPGPCTPVPLQARRRHQDPHVDLIERDHPGWAVHALPTVTREGTDYVATHAGHTVRADSPEELRRRIHEAETEPLPALVRRYVT
ncbi:hypothetical protein NE857_33690 (plasmid) [Nocardiopsis exhalans]|uniref:Uncharacterized protein n=1 Tax=Nocardiopsis exhalans TaxID=163604 RepID=A0ABY5DJZ2_9ACTN|nr:hypothetical protein [Nocardiopsis exhalans]USY23585.1 hypothetical protein NE857_33690 [Nocardiopsis exhalans]